MTGVSSSCGACKFLRRRCTEECIFTPYFSYEQAANDFAAVHKVFRASNVSKLLSQVPEQSRSDAAITITYEALARMEDPIYGCIAHIFALQQQVASLEEEIEMFGKELEMANFGTNSLGYQSSNPYFSTETEFSSHEAITNLHSCCSNMDVGMNDDIIEGYLLDMLVEQASQENYSHQDYNLQTMWVKYAAVAPQAQL